MQLSDTHTKLEVCASQNKNKEVVGDQLSEDLEKKGKEKEKSNYVWSIQSLENAF